MTQPVPFGRPFAAVLFDMDGTLLDSTESVRRCWLRWAGEHGVNVDQLRSAARHGVTSEDIVAALLPAEAVEAAVARIEDLEVADVDGTEALPGAAAALAAAGRRGAVVTSATARLARARLAAAGLAPTGLAPTGLAPAAPASDGLTAAGLTDGDSAGHLPGASGALVTADDVTRGKPDPEPYLRAAELLGVAAGDCLVVEDAPAGLESARAAGAATLAVTTTHGATELARLADAVVTTLGEVRLSSGPQLVLSQLTGDRPG